MVKPQLYHDRSIDERRWLPLGLRQSHLRLWWIPGYKYALKTGQPRTILQVTSFSACFQCAGREYFSSQSINPADRRKMRRPAVLSVSTERVLAPIRNAVLAHAGYGVIPVTTTESALQVLRGRHVCAMVIARSVPAGDRRVLCSEGYRYGVPSVVLDPYAEVTDAQSGLHMNPLEGPEVFLDALATLMQRDHPVCASR
jgi:hypothetical protein